MHEHTQMSAHHHRGGDVNGSVVVIMMMLTHVQVGYAYSIADVVDLRHSDFVTELDCICTHDVIYFNNFGKWFQGEPEYKFNEKVINTWR